MLCGASARLFAQSTASTLTAANDATSNPILNSESLDEVVVTASAIAVRKLDASYNIVSADAKEIKEANPKSAADILKLSPGLWPESSGGQTGANVEVAGFPSGGDAPFFTQMLEGLPLYGMPNLSFMDSTSLMRLDDTIDRLEIVQGGPAVVFGSGQIGATANYLLRTGSAAPVNSVGLTYGNEGLWRADVFYGFPIAEGWYGSVGGFYRVSNGVRPPSFPADQGGQFTGTLKHDLDQGSLTIWARVLDDKNQFMTPIPLIQSGSSTSFSSFPGFCTLGCAYGSHNIQNVTVPNPAGGFEGADLANGRGGQLYFFGVKWEQKLGEWSLSNDLLANGGGLDTNALFSGSNPRPLSYFLYGCNVPEPQGYCNGTTPVDTNNLNGGNGYDPALGYAVSASYAGSNSPVSLNQSVISQGWWYIQKSLQNIADEARVSREVVPGDTLTGGLYLARYSDNDNWSLGNQMLMANIPNTTAIVLNYVSGGGNCISPTVATNVHVCNLTSSQGFVNENGNFNILEHGDAMNVAGYLTDSWRSGPWLLDAGGRLEHLDAHQRTCNTTNQQLGTAYDLWDNAVPVCNGSFDHEHYVRTRPTYTAGANYEFATNMSGYLRYNNGVHYDDFDNGIRDASQATPKGFLPLGTVQNYEIGLKFQLPSAYLDLSTYYRTFDGLTYQETSSSGSPLGIFSTYGAETKGADVTAVLSPFAGFSLKLVGDYMDGHYRDQVGVSCFTTIFGAQQCVSVDGAPLQRQPRFQLRATPGYTYAAAWGDASAWMTYEYVGQRYEDLFGQQPLGAYQMLSAGLVANVGKNWQLRIQGTNLNNVIALTEGNARIAGNASGIGGVLLARPIEGREINFTGYYKF